MKKLLSLVIVTLVLVAPRVAKAADYAYSQYCLKGYRDQFGLDGHYPEFARYCADGSEFRGNIDDPELYTFAGRIYASGESPTAINWELQPLVKYIFGLGERVGIRPLTIQMIFFLWILLYMRAVARDVLKLNPLFAGLTMILFYIDPVVGEQLNKPYLDLGQTFFILTYFYYMWQWLTRKRSMVVPAILLGGIALSKSFSTGGLVAGYSLLYLWFTDRSRIKEYVISLWVTGITYCLGYTAFFVTHKPIDFVTLHIDILKFYKSYVPEYPKGEIFRIIFTGQWRTWYGDKGLIPSPEWSITWPISVGAAIAAAYSAWQERNKSVLYFAGWVALYFVFLSLRLVFPRYLVAIAPVLYLILSCQLQHIWYSLVSGNKSRFNITSKLEQKANR